MRFLTSSAIRGVIRISDILTNFLVHRYLVRDRGAPDRSSSWPASPLVSGYCRPCSECDFPGPESGFPNFESSFPDLERGFPDPERSFGGFSTSARVVRLWCHLGHSSPGKHFSQHVFPAFCDRGQVTLTVVNLGAL